MGITPNYDLDVDTSLGGNSASDYVIPSQKAIKTYVDNHSGGGTATDVQINGTSITSSNVANIITNSAYNASSNKIATMTDVPTSAAEVNAADTDLSNLSATGEAHFQTPLGYTAENASNKITSLSSSSTDTQYPSAKCVYDLIGDVETLLSQV